MFSVKNKTLVIGLLLSLLFPHVALATSSGAIDGTAASEDTSSGDTSWSTVSGAIGEGGNAAGIYLGFGVSSYYLVVKNPDFSSIPAGATINGIQVEVRAKSSVGVIEYKARLIKNGVIGSTARDVTGTLDGTYRYQSAGSDSDLWGDSWTLSDLNNANFGAAIQIEGFGDQTDIDNVRFIIEYTAGAQVPEFSTWAFIFMIGACLYVMEQRGMLYVRI